MKNWNTLRYIVTVQTIFTDVYTRRRILQSYFSLKGASRGHLVHPLLQVCLNTLSYSALYPVLNTSMERDSTTFLGNLFQY